MRKIVLLASMLTLGSMGVIDSSTTNHKSDLSAQVEKRRGAH